MRRRAFVCFWRKKFVSLGQKSAIASSPKNILQQKNKK
jgi:hypothetical protein